ncbi:antibiotic resistance protein MarC [Thermoproteus sp. CP80]|uniref:MarC family protein n=1 Tax=Thermoproteus sp. CP80 TaxID=1650659 RepID=UPI0009BE7186|nr:MarC family protein [Thermoproteus sp. CP80]PLC62323.1 antibiotic resistance protein MarC [Thermoproteus sp. CP80]
MTPLEFVEIVGQIYAIQNPIGKLGIVGEMAMDRPQEFRKAIRSMAITVIVLSTMFSLVGGPLLSALNVDMVGFKIAGGVIILSTSVTTLIHGSTTTLGGKLEEAAVVPLATPLIVGPGTMTTLILYSTIYGPTATLIASLTASALSVATLYLGARLVKLFGPVPAKALGRFMALIIATTGTELVLSGLSQYVERLRA